MAYIHRAVMRDEVARILDCRPGDIAVDGTVGGAGHARDICRRIMPGGVYVGFDQDSDAIVNAKQALAEYGPSIHLVHANFAEMASALDSIGAGPANAILLDLGISWHHISASGRGFSFQRDEPLDMRMDTRSGKTAADIVNTEPISTLVSIFTEYGEERYAKAIARRIARQRDTAPIKTSKALADLVVDAVPGKRSAERIHPATRVFMALRIVVNRELNALSAFLDQALDLLAPGGRICILSFHSLEDRMVKHRFRQWTGNCTCPPGLPVCGCGARAQVDLLTRRVIRPSAEEVAANPMARSTRLRAVAKLDEEP